MPSPKQVSNWLSSIAGQTGVNSAWLQRAADAGVINPSMSPDEVYRAVSNMAVPPPTRQLQLPMGDSADEIRALIPYGSRGAGQPGALTAPGVAVPPQGGALIPAPLTGLPAPQQLRLGTTAGVPAGPASGLPLLPAPPQRRLPYRPIDGAAWGMDSGVPAEPDFSLGSPLWGQMDKSARSYDNIRTGRTANLRNQNPDLVRIAQQNIQDANQAAAQARAAASRTSQAMGQAGELMMDYAPVAGAAGVLAYGASRGTAPAPVPALSDTSGTAELANESRPVPSVQATPDDEYANASRSLGNAAKGADNATRAIAGVGKGPATQVAREATGQARPPVEPEELDPSARARQLIDQLNAASMRGGVSEEQRQATMAEIRRLLAMGNQRRRDAGAARFQPTGQPPSAEQDPSGRAKWLLAQLNADRQRAGGEVPHAAQVNAEVNRLLAQANARRNSRY